MKRQQAIKMLRQWHEECIKAGKALPKTYGVIVETRERIFKECSAYVCSATVWDEERNDPATQYRDVTMYTFRSDKENVKLYDEALDAFKADVERIVNENKKQSAA